MRYSNPWLLFSLYCLLWRPFIWLLVTIQALVLLLTQTTNALFNSQYCALIILESAIVLFVELKCPKLLNLDKITNNPAAVLIIMLSILTLFSCTQNRGLKSRNEMKVLHKYILSTSERSTY